MLLQMVEDDVYVGSDGDVEGVGDDQLVTDELLDVDDGGDDDGTVDVLDDSAAGDATDVKDQEEEQADVDAGKKTSHKRSRSKSPPASHEKEDFEDDELDSEVEEAGRTVSL